jgi:hypothetical protein
MDDIIQQGSDAAGAAGGSRGGMTEGTGMESVEGTEAATPVPEDSKPYVSSLFYSSVLPP